MRLRCVVCSLALIFGAWSPLVSNVAAQKRRGGRAKMIRFEPNVYAPDLYTESIKMRFTLVNLPGAATKGSYWEGQYHLYFLPEGEIRKVRKPNPELGDFPNKILLAEGSFKGARLKTLAGRTFVRGPVPFKPRIPDGARTKFANILTSYTIKVYDARLKKTLYRSSIFIAHPFDDDERHSVSEQFIPRKTVYASFFISSDGDLFSSQERREAGDLEW